MRFQLGICRSGFDAGDRAVIDDRRPCAIAGLNMTVDGIVAGVNHPIGIPFIQRRIGIIQGFGWLFVPVYGGRRMHPKRFGVLLPTVVDFRIAHGRLFLFAKFQCAVG